MARNTGTPGDDRLFSERGEDTEILGLSGDDTLQGGSGAETLNGGEGDDWVYYTTEFDGTPVFLNGVTVSLEDGEATFFLDDTFQKHEILGIENFRGSRFSDKLIGDAYGNEIQGHAGDDQIFGLAGDDRIFGGTGNDSINGGDGNDSLYAMAGNETLNGDAGDDLVAFSTTSDGTPVFDQGVSADLSEGNASAVVEDVHYAFVLENFRDLTGSDDDDHLTGDNADNILQGKSGNDVLFGLAGNDELFGGQGDDTLNGGEGSDTLFATEGNDVLLGDVGDDEISFYTFTGGEAIFDQGVNANLSAGTATADVGGQGYVYTLQDFRNLTGTQSDDSLTGDDGDNELQGRSGDDVLFGLGGNDELFGGSGQDTLKGGDGNDTIFATDGNGTLSGDAGDDLLTFRTWRSGEPIFDEGVKVDLQNGTATAQVGDLQYDYILQGFERLAGSAFSDVLTGDSTENLFYGYQGDDALYGLGGDDELYGGSGNDTLDGGEGDDRLLAMSGNETLIGGNGEDTVSFGTFEAGDLPVFVNGVAADLGTGKATADIDGISYQYSFESVENLSGSRFSDTLIGDAQNNVIEGGDGDDIIKGGAGDDFIRGGYGNDIALYDGSHLHFTIQFDLAEESVSIIDRTGAEGTDSFGTNILSFSDRDFTLVADGDVSFSEAAFDPNDFQDLVELYIAYFNRAPDAEGLYFWTRAFLNGTTLDQAAEFFFHQPETQALYGAEVQTSDFVTSVYENVLGRGPDDSGAAFWVSALESDAVSEGQFIRDFLQGLRAPVADDAPADFISQLDVDRAYLNNKNAIGIDFGILRGMSDLEDANAVMSLFDGSDESVAAARAMTGELYEDALATDGTGAFLIQLVGLADNPFGDPAL